MKKIFLLTFIILSLGFAVNPILASDEISANELEHLISGQEVKTKTVAEVAEIYNLNASELSANLSSFMGISVKPEQSFQFLHDNYGLAPSDVISIADAMVSNSALNINIANDDVNEDPPYEFINIIIITLILYFITWFLSKKKIIKKWSHLYFWNIILLITFLGSAILGILLVMRINKGIIFALPFNILYWHVEMGLAMAVISILHIFNHTAYFLLPFKRK